jgi:integrase
MRLEGTAKADQYKVWLTEDELEELRRYAASARDDLIIQLGGYVGLRAFEVPQIQPRHVKEIEGQYRLHVPKGKDTKNGVGEPRDAFLPKGVERDIQQYQRSENIAPKDPLVDLTERGIRAVVKRTARGAADDTGVEEYRHVSSHDLRRRFAQRLLVEKQVNPRVVMQVGGWDSFQAIEPYLNAPTPDVVNEEFEEAGLT